jgi:adenosylcobinamide-phosphate synthase
VQLGGSAMYHGQLEMRPPLGAGAAPGERDIGRAVTLVRRGMWLWLALAGIGGWALA